MGGPLTLRRRSARALIATVAVLAALVSPVAARPAAAAEDGLSLVSNSTYTLVPEQALVHVSVTMTAQNTKPNLVRETPTGTVTTRYFFETASLAIHPEATGISAASDGVTLRTRLTPDDGFSVLKVDFPRDLYVDQTVSFTVDFDLPGGAPRSDSDIRVGSAFATFYAWAFGDSGDVRILVPAAYEVEASGSPTRESVEAGITTIAATGISDVTDWYTIIVADRHDALTQDRLDLADGENLVIRAWPEDVEWRTRVRDLLEIGLPVLADKIGLAWPVDGEMEVAEVHTPLLEGYAGFFYTEEDRIEISEDLDELTIMHEASHAWFNDGLFVGRWIGEGLADEYAARVLDEVSNGGLAPEQVGRLSPGAIALNEWAPPGRIDDDDMQARETYGYNASWALVRALVDEIGEDAMRQVFAAAAARRTAYVGAVEPETITYANDWRRLLDLLEEDGGSTDAIALFRQAVVSDSEKVLLEERAAARRAYTDLVEAGDGWLPGYAVRDPMGRWQFDRAHEAIEASTELLAMRDEIETAAGEIGVTPPPSLREAYESADGHLENARALAADQLAMIGDMDAAAEAVAAGRDPISAIGLLGTDLAAAIERAEGAFEGDDPDAAQSEIDAVEAVLAGAGDAGRVRVGAAALAVVVVAGGVGLVVTRRRRRADAGAAMWPVALTADVQPEMAVAAVDGASVAVTDPAPAPDPIAASVPDAPEPYATLGAPRPADAAPGGPDDEGKAGGEGS